MKSIAAIAAASVLACILTACSLVTDPPSGPPEPDPAPVNGGTAVIVPSIDMDAPFADPLKEECRQKLYGPVKAACGIMNEVRDREEFRVLPFDPAVMTRMYDALTAQEKGLYDLMLDAARNFGVYEIDEDKLERGFTTWVNAFDAVSQEQSRYFSYTYPRFDPLTRLYHPVYFYPEDTSNHPTSDLSALKERMEELFAYADAMSSMIVESIPEGLSDYRKCMYLAVIVQALAEYDYTLKTMGATWKEETIFSKGIGVCENYAAAYCLLAREAGLNMDVATGTNVNGESHAWNVFETDKGLYYIDTTFMDTSGADVEDGELAMAYFFMSEEELKTLGYERK